ncbi:iron(III) transport system substrate-binding protein [Labrenzia sp. EL_13]|nr:iron(III) transport system substrate-binding protein [Labrenzia sp. EL_142]MBG6202282.1 iron(III) transport system substrate-binding protein [Labrenzia sp. EL_13]
MKKTVLTSLAGLLALGGAAQADPLVVYSPQGGERAEWIAEQAAAAGHDIEILNAGGGELFDRLLAEKNNPQADVVFGLVDMAMSTLKSEGLFQSYTPTWADGLPDEYVDPDGIVHKFWQTPIVIAINTDKLSAGEAPKSWLDLTDPVYKGKYVVGSTSWQTTRTFLAGILARFMDENGKVSDEGWKFMETFYANAILANDGDSKTQAYASGDALIDLNWFGGAYRQAENVGYTVELIDTEGGTPFIAEGIAIMEGTDQLDQAKSFVDWFGSPEFMGAYATRFNQAPAHPEAIALAPTEVQEKAKLVTAQPVDWDLVAGRIDGWIQRIELEIK